ncbi:tRNA uridine-5-carboxymethylaminomethyl(34) synthesis GTPase MnmE [Thermoproteota archaeon]
MKKISPNDTIAAISTPIGEGAIGMVRMSGSESLNIADKIFKGSNGKPPSRLKSHTVRYGRIVEESKSIDEVLLTVMRAPKTYTREDVVEISCHGGAVALRRILESTVRFGARLAEPGEFTKRAFLNGRIDLSKAEAVLSIVQAKTEAALKLGIEQLSGGLSDKIKKIRKDLVGILSHIEADIDFCDQEIETGSCKKQKAEIKNVIKDLQRIIDDSHKVNFFREGIKVTICGRPNVGKSSLLNALLRKERAIVTNIAGTTRDVIEEFINLGGIGIRLVDTAGVVKPKNIIEHHAIRLAKDSIALSDVVLLVFDSSQKLTKKDLGLMRELRPKNVIAVLNKIDLPLRIQVARIRKEFRRVVLVSSLTQKNLDRLERTITSFAYKGKIISSEGLVTTNARQLQEIKKTRDLVANAQKSILKKLSLEFVALDLRVALDCLGRITGESVDDAVLDKIFNEFCIGK